MTNPSSKLPNLTVGTWDFVNRIESIDLRPLYELTPIEAREFLRGLQKEDYRNIDADINEINMDNIKTYVIRPKNTTEKLPVVLYFHGGGWVMGDEYVYDNLVKNIVNCADVAIIFPEYSLAPEAHYPTQIDEACRVLKYIKEHDDELNVDVKKLAIVGDSAGGNMAAAVSMRVKNEIGMPQIKFQMLIYPVCNADMDTESYESFKDGPWLTKKAMEWFWDSYAPDKQIRKERFVSPLHAEIEELKGLPPTLVITDENDILRDEGEAYARKLDEAGVNVLNVRINGTFHDFLMLNALQNTEPVRGAIKIICSQLKTHLS